MLPGYLSERTHICRCGLVLDRDLNAAINILNLGLSTTGHVGTWVLNPNASGDSTTTQVGAILLEQVGSMNEETPRMQGWGVSNYRFKITDKIFEFMTKGLLTMQKYPSAITSRHPRNGTSWMSTSSCKV